MPWITFALWGGALAAQRSPEVLMLDPGHLAIDVDAKTTRVLTVQFDQDMDQNVYSVCGGGPGFPAMSSARWRDARTFVLEVTLEEDHVYSMDLSCAGSSGFFSAKGVRLAPVPWRIATLGPEVGKEVREAAATRLFRALRDRYSYRDRLGIDWDDFEHRSFDGLVEVPNMAALALRMAELLTTPQDPHISVRWRDAVTPTFQRPARSNFDARALQRVLPKLTKVGRIGLQARTADDIGYLMIGTFAPPSDSDFDQCLQALRKLRDCKGLIIDVRSNGGGDEDLARRLAGFFVEGNKVYAAHRVRDDRAEDGFGPRQERTVRGNAAPDVYTGPVAVLMGPHNMSSCEAFLLMMKQASHATLIGDTSYGSSGNPQSIGLASGLYVMLPSWQALRPDGSCFEGEGIEPTVHITFPEGGSGESDPVLDEALTRLRAGR
ncbi:MAG: S41 family peptidase [Planctomycetes bacterium]|nr:S41 family peptidase [Planctomycetota bacterium]